MSDLFWWGLAFLIFFLCSCCISAEAEKIEKQKRLEAERRRLRRVEEEKSRIREPQWFPTLQDSPNSHKLLLQEHAFSWNSALTGTHFTLYDGNNSSCDKVMGSQGVHKFQGNEILLMGPNEDVILKFVRSFTAVEEAALGFWLIKNHDNQLLGTIQIEPLCFGIGISKNYNVEFGTIQWHIQGNQMETQYTITEGYEKIAWIDQGVFGFLQADSFNSYTIEVYDERHLVLVTGLMIAVDTSRDLIRAKRADAHLEQALKEK